MKERVIVLERETAFLVVSADDPDDWIACFQKSTYFPAQDWAERMAYLYNLRLSAARQL